MKGHFYKPRCKCVDAKGKSKKTKKCNCGATWSYIVDIGRERKTGIRKQQKKGGFKNKGEAQSAAAIVIAQVTQGTFMTESELLFEEVSKIWYDAYKSTGKVKTSTLNTRKYNLICLNAHLGKDKIKSITGPVYQDVINELSKTLSYRTVVNLHAVAKMVFRKAIELELIRKDPTEFAYIPKPQKTVQDLEETTELPKFLEKEELIRFLDIAKSKGNYRDYEIFLTLAYTGMRAGELCSLKWKDINFEDHTISITKTLHCPGKVINYILLTPKTEESVRIIDVDELVINALKDLQVRQDAIINANSTYYDADFVFAKKFNKYLGYPETTPGVERRMQILLEIAGLSQELTPHSLRHTHTSLLAEASVPLHEIQARLGHKDDAVTRTVYLHVTKDRKKETVKLFSKLMSQAKKAKTPTNLDQCYPNVTP